MDQNETLQFLCSLCEVSCLELFESFGGDVSLVDEVEFDSSDVPTSVIEAGNGEMEASLMMNISFSILSKTYPVERDRTNIGESEMEDWLCELANRLLGKFKNKLHQYSCLLKPGLPEYYPGTDDYECGSPMSIKFPFFFEIEGEVCKIVLGLELFSEHMNFIENTTYDHVVEEGDIDYL